MIWVKLGLVNWNGVKWSGPSHIKTVWHARNAWWSPSNVHTYHHLDTLTMQSRTSVTGYSSFQPKRSIILDNKVDFLDRELWVVIKCKDKALYGVTQLLFLRAISWLKFGCLAGITWIQVYIELYRIKLSWFVITPLQVFI